MLQSFILQRNENKLIGTKIISIQVVILNWFDDMMSLKKLIEINRLYNVDNVLMSEFYLKVLKQAYEKR